MAKSFKPRRRRFLRKRKTTLKTKVNRIQRIVNRIRPETKHYDFLQQSLSLLNHAGSTGQSNFIPFGAIGQGLTDFGDRIGDRVSAKRLYIKGGLFLSPGAEYDVVRLAIFWNKSNSDATDSTVSIINQYFQSAGDNTSTAPFMIKDWDNSSNFDTIYDRTYNLFARTNDLTLTAGKYLPISINLNLRGRKVQYYNNTQGITMNNLFVVFYSTADSKTLFNGNVRVTYTDA